MGAVKIFNRNPRIPYGRGFIISMKQRPFNSNLWNRGKGERLEHHQEKESSPTSPLDCILSEDKMQSFGAVGLSVGVVLLFPDTMEEKYSFNSSSRSRGQEAERADS